ncbi:MAG: hypothetical protein M3R12_08480 [Actinomycetota bacterium]|nr:hypothetical protein [Actinomycetota bacterium]
MLVIAVRAVPHAVAVAAATLAVVLLVSGRPDAAAASAVAAVLALRVVAGVRMAGRR